MRHLRHKTPDHWRQSSQVTPNFQNSRVLPGDKLMRGAKARDFATDSPKFGVRSTHRVRTQLLISNDLNIAAFDVDVEFVDWQKDIDAIVFADFKKAIFDWT
jgi:hypothetical protein